MKLTKTVMRLLATGAVIAGVTVACGGSSNNGDGGTGGNGQAGAGNEPTLAACEAACTGTTSGVVCLDSASEPIPFQCGTGEVCKDAKCVGMCKPGAIECVTDGVQRVCAADGRSWVSTECASGESCVDGKCGLDGGLVCIPGARECDGTKSSKTCKADGSGWDTTKCTGSTECSDGACRGSVCELGATKCDDSVMDIPRDMVLAGNPQPNFGVVWKCTDGESWVPQPCDAAADGNYPACAYSGLDASAVAKYREEVNLWLAKSNQLGDPDPNTPVPPAIPAGTKAACEDNPAPWQAAFFESPSASRSCGRPNWKEGDPQSYQEFTQLNGFLPYSPLSYDTTECSGLTACGYSQRGCFPTVCLPDETNCSDASSYEYCAFDYNYPSNSYWSDATKCGGDPGVCKVSGADGARQAACDGVAVSILK